MNTNNDDKKNYRKILIKAPIADESDKLKSVNINSEDLNL